MKTEKNYQIRVAGKGNENTFAKVFGQTEKSATAAAKRIYPGDYDYYLYELMDNGEWAYMHRVY